MNDNTNGSECFTARVVLRAFKYGTNSRLTKEELAEYTGLSSEELEEGINELEDRGLIKRHTRNGKQIFRRL